MGLFFIALSKKINLEKLFIYIKFLLNVYYNLEKRWEMKIIFYYIIKLKSINDFGLPLHAIISPLQSI